MQAKRRTSPPRRERGYALLSLLAGMTIAAIVLGSAMEPTKHRMQREKEEEALYRGAQVATAIWQYYNLRSGGTGAMNGNVNLNPAFLPTKLEDLTKEYVVNGKKQYLIRPAALHDPLMSDGEWRAVRIGDPLIGDLYRAYLKYVTERSRSGGLSGEELARMQMTTKMLQDATALSGIQIKPSTGGQDGGATADGADGAQGGSSFGSSFGPSQSTSTQQVASSFSLNPESRPIIGVVSRSKEKLIRNYFGMSSYDQAMFFPGVQRTGSVNLLAIGGNPSGDPNGNFTGVAPSKIVDGKCPPSKRGQGIPGCP